MSSLICTTNDKYLPLTTAFLHSLFSNSPHTFNRVIVRCVNFDPDFSNISSNIVTLLDNKMLCSKKKHFSTEGGLINEYITEGLQKSRIGFRGARWLYSEEMAYCSNIKTDTILMALEDYNEPVVYSDVDTIIRGDLTGLLNIVKTHDISVVEDISYTEQFGDVDRLSHQDKLYQGGLIGFNTTHNTLKFVKQWRDHVMNNYTDWDADERYFYDTVNSVNSVSIGNIDNIYKDEDMSDRAIVWSGAGITKYCDEKYTKEYNRYITT